MKGRGYKIIAVCADLHIGVKSVPPAEMKKQFKKHFFGVLEKLAVLDEIVVAGDLSHTILSLNSEASNLYLWFVNKLYKLARKKGAGVLIIRGTPSHDVDKLRNIAYLQDNEEGVDFRIYDTVEEITLFDDYKVLVLPDVRVKQLQDIDKYLKPNKYDLIFGHGMTDKFQAFISEVENQPAKTYVYDTNRLMEASKGPVVFGHVHQYQSVIDKTSHKPKFFYCGPFTIMERATHDPGWLLIGIDDSNHRNYKVEHIDNPDSADFIEMEVTGSMLTDIPIDDLIGAIDEVAADAKANDLITLRIVRGDDQESAAKVLMLETRYRKDSRFSIVKKIKNKKEQEREARQAERKERYSYLLDQNPPLHEILFQYYQSDVKPTLADQSSKEANLTEEDFRRALEE